METEIRISIEDVETSLRKQCATAPKRYARWIAQGTMTRREAIANLAQMHAALEVIEEIRGLGQQSPLTRDRSITITPDMLDL
jgi:hypothetical protein